MPLSDRLVLVVFFVFLLTFGLFWASLRGMPGNVQAEIDRELNELAVEMVQASQSQGNVDLDLLDWPNNNFRTAGSFYVILGPQGNVIKRSVNYPETVNALAPALVDNDNNSAEPQPPKLEFRNLKGDNLRIIHYPIIGTFEDGSNIDGSQLQGYLQVGRLVNDYTAYARLTEAATWIGLAALSSSICILIFFVPYTLRPLTKITRAAQQITSADELSRRMPPYPIDDEIGQLTQVLNKFMERLDNQFKTQQRLLQDVSHELRTPLTAIRGNVDLIRHTGVPDAESLNAIDEEAQRMTRLVSDLLSLARADVGGLPIRQEVVELDRVFLMTYEQVCLIDNSIRVILTDVEPATVLGDEDRLKQLMLNLMTNAIKYSNPGDSVKVALARDGNQAVLTVADTGMGIAAEDLPHIFERFYRVNKARSRERGGSGLGLAIVKSIVRAHRGRISADSETGVGSTFTVRLPIYEFKGLPATVHQNGKA